MSTKNKTTQFKVIRYIGITMLLFIGFLIARNIAWQGNKTLHTLMEVIATFLALMVGILALVRFYTERSNTFLFIGSGFLGTAFLDGYHAVVTSTFFDNYFPSPPASLIPWSWVASRAFLSILMVLSWRASAPVKSHNTKSQVQIPEWIVFSGMGAATLFSFLFFAFYPLPTAYYPNLIFGRPEEFLPALFFLIALVGYLRKGNWKDDPFEDWLVISLIIGLMGQVMFMSFSYHLFDTMFDAAHLLKKVSYICMMQGLFITMFQLFKQVESRKKELESVVESSPNGMIMISGTDGRIRLVNGVVEKIFGYTRKELIGRKIETLIPKRFRNSHSEHISNFLNSPKSRGMGNGKHGMIFFGLRVDGCEVPLEIGLGYIDNDSGIFILITLANITERWATEQKLASERKALEKVNLELDSFVYTASHDLRAPLRGINSFAKFIEDDYSDRLDDEGRDYLRRIRNGANRMTALIDDLLSLSKISRQKNPYESVKITELVRSVTERIEFDIESSRVNLIIPDHLPTICCDRIKITEVFVNLINNAIKFSLKNTNGGPKVEIGCQEQNGDYRFSVRDNGIGIDPKYHEKIFGIFQRLHTRGEYEGTGAGLSIVKRVIDDHKGRIWIESELGKGATFNFTIPKKVEEKS